jgi:serine/threonine-protein kinase Chk2
MDPPIDPPGFSSPPQETQAFSQFVYPTSALSDEVEDETKEGVWGYLLPLDPKYGKTLVLKKRNACPLPEKNSSFGKSKKAGETKDFGREEEAYEETKLKGIASGGYLVGRHPECGKLHRSCRKHPN